MPMVCAKGYLMPVLHLINLIYLMQSSTYLEMIIVVVGHKCSYDLVPCGCVNALLLLLPAEDLLHDDL